MAETRDTTPTAFVLFGATGDLARRMVLPAFYRLAVAGLLPEQWVLIGNGRGDVSHDEFRDRARAALEEFGPEPEEHWDEFAARLRFAGGGFSSDDPGSLPDVLGEVREALGGQLQLVHYIALPPTTFAPVTEALAAHGLTEGARVVYEKPFGTSPEDFRSLDETVHRVLDEEQVFRIDHFLGKEGSQNLHALRFGNGLFERVWNREHVRAVQIDVPEDLDIADRAEFYDATGAMLDMVVTHLFQLAAEVAMEPPTTLSAEDLQTARETVIGAFRPLAPEDVVLGQYDDYRETDGVADDSTRDTFTAARLWIDTDRWRDVPFLLRTGKRMARSEQRVSLVFREAAGPLAGQLPPLGNVLSIALSGSGAIRLGMVVKEPGPELTLADATTALELDSVEGADPLPPYGRLIVDVLRGDRTLFTRPDGLAAAWDALTPVLEHPPEVQPYAPGSWGPAAAVALVEPEGWLLEQED